MQQNGLGTLLSPLLEAGKMSIYYFLNMQCYHLLATSGVGLDIGHDVLLYFSRFCPDDQGFSKIKTFLISF